MTDSKQRKGEFDGFGVAKSDGIVVLPHHFRVSIPPSPQAPVSITEDYGIAGGEDGIPYEETRVILPRTVWTAISAAARNDFNARLKRHKLPVGQWKIDHGNCPVRVERLLGKELCVLAWAAEHTSSKEKLATISQKWSSLRHEERWWLFSMTVAEAGRAEDSLRGWRQALHHALSDAGSEVYSDIRRRRPLKEHGSSPFQPEFFGASNG